ncbi:MAG: hypothetical protein WC815_05225 [Vicinamibacterales bacterium]|jgi:hypothetical protein
MADLDQKHHRLDSWKAIADYLQRDVATVRRWEKNLALPVHRVGGIGRSVFADSAEIDAWLTQSRPQASDPSATGPILPTGSSRQRQSWPWLLLLVVAFAFVVGLYARTALVGVGDLDVEVTAGGVIARDAARVEQWRHEFDAGYRTFLPPAPVQVVAGKNPGVYVATSYRARQHEDQVEGGELSLFDVTGRLQRTFSFSDRVSFHGQPYSAPWAITAFTVNPAGGEYSVAVTGHHYTWDPGVLTILDAEWRRRGTFVHAGWIEQVRWLDHRRLAIGGFSNAHDGGMVSLIDAAALDGQGPEPSGSRHFCETCGPNAPLKMVIFPRTELNRLSGSPFNRVILATSGDRLSARTIEMPAERGDAVAVYEFTASLDLVSAQFGDRYWEMHRSLEADGRITHRRDQCPDRDGPRQMQMWEPASGWRTVRIR